MSIERRESKHFLFIIIYGFCSNNAMLFSQQVLHLQYLFFKHLFIILNFFRLFLFQINSQPGVAYKMLLMKKACLHV